MTIRQFCSGLVATVLVAGALQSCSSSTSADPNGATVNMQSELSSTSVSGTMEKGGKSPSGVTFVDSVQITSARFFLKDLKMHRAEEDTLKDEKSGTVKTGAFIVAFDSAGAHVISQSTVPAGTYDRIKFELHKPDSKNDVGIDFGDPANAEFITGDRYTVIIKGYSYRLGVKTAFTVRSRVSENIQVRFPNNITLAGGTVNTIAFQFDPRIVFANLGGGAIDPTNAGNQGVFDARLKLALKLLKR